MATQSITDQTFVGTSDPKTLEYSLSYYGPKVPSAQKTTIGDSAYLVDKTIKVLWLKLYTKVTTEWTAGIALPSWTASSTVVGGEISDDTMTLTLQRGTSSAMGGMLLGVEFDLNIIVQASTWIPGYLWHHWWHAHWVSGHWDDLPGINHNFSFSLVPLCVDIVYALAKLIPGFKKLVAIIPQGLLDHMQDYEDGFAGEAGVFLDPKMPMKWDLIFIGRQCAEVGADAIGAVLTVGDAVVIGLIALAELAISIEEKIGVCVQLGPEICLVFPLHVKITGLIADDVTFESLEFSGDTITGTNPDGQLNIQSQTVSRIGFRCEQILERMEYSVGVWFNASFKKVISIPASKDFDPIQYYEKKHNIDYGIGSFSSSMTNEIGKNGQYDLGQPPEFVEVKFI